MEITKIAHHRNGVAGEGFTVGIISNVKLQGIKPDQKFLVIQFNDEIRTAVLDLDLLKKDVIEFGKNSWRGDTFADEFKINSEIALDKQIEALLK